MAQREFEITIKPDGKVELHILGFKGKSGCLKAAALFEKVVGHIESLRETSEYYEPEQTVHIDQQH